MWARTLREGHVRAETGTGVGQPQAKAHWGPWKLEEARVDPPLELLEGVWPCPQPDVSPVKLISLK